MTRSNKGASLAMGVSLLIAVTGLSHGASPDDAAIRAQTTSWEKAFAAGDAKALAALYAEDAVLSPPGVPPVRGRAAIHEYFVKDAAAAKAAGATFTLNPKTDVGVSGNMGWESGTFKVTIKGAVVDTGKFLSVSRKKDGKWLYIRDMWNSDAPPAPPVPAPAPAAPPPPPKK